MREGRDPNLPGEKFVAGISMKRASRTWLAREADGEKGLPLF